MEKQRFIFDLDGTLLLRNYSYNEKYFKSVLSRCDAQHFIPLIPRLLEKYETIFKKYDIDMLSKYLTKMSDVFISSKMIVDWNKALIETDSKVIDHVVEVLEYLNQKGKSTAILTNWFLEVQIARLEKAGIRDYFDEFYGGDTYLKPRYQSYLNACGRYLVEEVVMIGDTLEKDVYGPMQIGMEAIYYNPKNNGNFDKDKVKSIGSMSKIKEMY